MLQVNGLYGHIRRNALVSVLLLLSFAALIVAFWGAWCVIYAAVADYWSFVPKHGHAPPTVDRILRHAAEIAWRNAWMPPMLTAIWFASAYAFHDAIIDSATGAQPVERKQAPQLYNLVENLAIAAGQPMPRVEIMETPELNAYASGKSPRSASIAVTRGLLDALDEDELEAVLAHEMTHIVNYDVTFMAVATVFAGGLTLVGNWAGNIFGGDSFPSLDWQPSRSSSSSSDSSDGGQAAAFVAAAISVVIAIGMLALVHLLAIVIRLAISRRREYMADGGSAELTKRPEALVSALRKIDGRAEIPGLSPSVAAMMIGGRTGWFDTHPSTEARVAALQSYAGASAAPRRAHSFLPAGPARPFGRRGSAA